MESPRFTLPLIRTRQGMLDDGFSDSEIRDALKAGTLVRVRRGCYLDGPTKAGDATRTDLAATAAGVAALAARSAMAAGGEEIVFSHATAAALWQLPFLAEPPATIHFTVPRDAHGIRRAGVHQHIGGLVPEEIVEHRGIRLTSLARTLVDVARSEGFREGVVMADHAMHLSRDPEALRCAMQASIGRLSAAVRIGNARRMAAFAVTQAESPGESLSRIVFREQNVPVPVLQHRLRVRLPTGGWIDCRTDFAWERQKVVGEFDGRAKYERYLSDGETPGDVVFEEKRREDAIRAAEWFVIRWTWQELSRPEMLGRRVREVLAARS